MMQQIPSKVKLEVKSPDELLGPVEYFDGGGGVMMAFRQSEPYEPERFSPAVRTLVEEIEKIRDKRVLFVQINRLDPGVVIEKHTDTLKVPYRVERWHLPIQTNPEAWHWQEDGGKFNMTEGVWYGPVPYWELHNGGNDGKTPRIHLIVDLETGGAPVILEAPPKVVTGTGAKPPVGKVIDLSAENKLEMASSGS